MRISDWSSDVCSSDLLSLRNDELSRLGGTTEITVPDTDGSIAAFEGFAELQVPLIADQPFFRSLDLDLSARVADYYIGTVGTVLNSRGGIRWRPVDALQFSVHSDSADRAPALTEQIVRASGGEHGRQS